MLFGLLLANDARQSLVVSAASQPAVRRLVQNGSPRSVVTIGWEGEGVVHASASTAEGYHMTLSLERGIVATADEDACEQLGSQTAEAERQQRQSVWEGSRIEVTARGVVWCGVVWCGLDVICGLWL